jgi:uncharacterized repeat protein (TIGR01451 family)
MAKCTPAPLALILRLLSITLIALLLLTPQKLLHADPVVRYAAPAPLGNGDCSSWADACSLPTALASAGSGDEVWVQMGVHKPTDTTDRTIAFALPAGVAVYGGFAGTETQLAERDWQLNLTILSGDIDNNDMTDPTGVVTDTANIIGANSYHVVNSLLNDTGRLDGFVITAGDANDDIPPFALGGGMYNEYSSLAVVNVTLVGNRAFLGGGMFNYHSSPQITAVTFHNNSALAGGGLFNVYSAPMLAGVLFSGNAADSDGGGMLNDYQSSPTLIDITFQGNTAANRGGGLHNDTSSSNPTLTQVTFADNSAIFGGGMFNQAGEPTLTDVLFDGNTAVYGGGINNEVSSPVLTAVTFYGNWGDFGGGIYNNASSPTLSDVTFAGNTGLYGAGIYNEAGSNPELTAVTFTNNQANWDGGGMYNNASSPTLIGVTFYDNMVYNGNGGGLHNINGSHPSLVNVVFAGNTANLSGGGVYNNMNSSPTLTNATLSGNMTIFFDGGALYNGANSNPLVNNSILWGNSAGRDGDEIFNTWNSAPTIAYSDIQGSGGSGTGWDAALGTDGGGNLDADPRFIAPAIGNLRLGPDSPAIDAGDNTAVPPGIVTDLDSHPRFVDIPFIPDSGQGTPPIVDMGAYEASFADLPLGQTVTPAAITPGEMLTFTLTLNNSGSLTLTQVVLTNTLPAHLSPTAVLASGVIITDTGANPAFVWGVADLAPGQTGVITMSAVLTTPLAAGVYTQTAHVYAANDAWPLNNSAIVTYTVANVAPTFSSTAVLTATQDALYTYTVETSDENGDMLIITAPLLPDWLTLTDHGDGTAVLSGTPTSADIGDHSIALRVTDEDGLYSDQTFSVVVLAKPEFALYLPLVVRAAR